MRVGTGYFTTLQHAIAYYRKQGIDSAGVRTKLREGEIHIGTPACSTGQTLRSDGEGRWWITEGVEPAPVVPALRHEDDGSSVVLRRHGEVLCVIRNLEKGYAECLFEAIRATLPDEAVR